MRLGPDDVAAQRYFRESATARPLFDRFDEAAADAEPALSIRDYQSPDFAMQRDLQKFVMSPVNPTNHFGSCRHEDRVVFQVKKAREPLRHDALFNGISELPA